MTVFRETAAPDHGRRYIRQAMQEPILTKDFEHDLAKRWACEKDTEALHLLVKSYSRLAIKVASRFKGYGLPLDDLIQEGNTGLLQALERFDPDRGVRLSTYASWWIRASIQDYILRNWSIVRFSTATKEKTLFFGLRRLRAKIAAASLGLMTDKDRTKVAEALRVTANDVETMEHRLSAGDQSLNAPRGLEGDAEWQDWLPDDRPTPEAAAVHQITFDRRKDRLRSALSDLPERWRIIIEQRHLSDDPQTLSDLGDQFGVSKERIRQLEKKALERLGERLRAEEADVEACSEDRAL